MLPGHRFDLVTPPHASKAVLVLHPHPEMGGDRFNPVVDTVYREATSRGWAAVRFDFSSSDFEVAVAEATSALDLLPVVPQLGVVGYSFGAAVAARLVTADIDAWALVAPPFGHRFPADDLPVGADNRPKLLLSPEHDQFCPPDAAAMATVAWRNTTVEPVASTDHFLTGFLSRVATRALDWIEDAL